MGKKYIVELESGTHIFVLGPEGIVHIGEPDVVYETVDGMQIGDAVINAEPYTEPDLEQVRKEAYDEGYADAKCGYKNGFENGMIVAWDAAKKIVCYEIDGGYPIPQMLDLFNRDDLPKILSDYTASEAIEKIRQYEQRQEEQIQVGDEVIPRETEYDTMIVTRLWKDDYDSDCIDAIGFDGKICSFLVSRVSKTGKHYEIATILENMREGQDG